MKFNMFRLDCPCQDCDGHTSTCHGECEKYAAYKAEYNRIKKSIAESDNGEQAVYQYRHSRFVTHKPARIRKKPKE